MERPADGKLLLNILYISLSLDKVVVVISYPPHPQRTFTSLIPLIIYISHLFTPTCII